ncbi:tetratricopeptide repeat protein 17-like isoform X2 [Lampetra fluviatilis]
MAGREEAEPGASSPSRSPICAQGFIGAAALWVAATLFALPGPSAATTHWVVTEDGRIQQQVDSQLNLKHPHDLVLFMRQEARLEALKELELVLMEHKIHIEENEDKDTRLEERHYAEEPACTHARVPLGDLDLYHGTYIALETKNIRPEDHIDVKHKPSGDLLSPDCMRILELAYSIHAFQHLRGVQERGNLSAPLLSPEDPVFQALPLPMGTGSLDELGHLIHLALQQNKTSWVLYNMASYYWRLKNSPTQVAECAMRALHLSPRPHHDVALVNLASVLHRAHYSADAAVLLHAALPISSDPATVHYTLGNVYAMLGEYNHSVLFYEQALVLRPELEAAGRRRHAVLCQQGLERKLEAQHRSLQQTLSELKEYQRQHEQYVHLQEQVERHKVPADQQLLHTILHEAHLARDTHSGNSQVCRWSQQQKLLVCQWDQPVRYTKGEGEDGIERVQFGEEEPGAGTTALPSRADFLSGEDLVSSRPHHHTGPRARSHHNLPASVQWLARLSRAKDNVTWALSLAIDKCVEPRWVFHVLAGLHWRGEGKAVRAAACLQAAVRLAPQGARHVPLTDHAALALHLSQLTEAALLLNHSLNHTADQAAAFLVLGNVLLDDRKASGAVEAFDRALQLNQHCDLCGQGLLRARCLQLYPTLYKITTLSRTGNCSEQQEVPATRGTQDIGAALPSSLVQHGRTEQGAGSQNGTGEEVHLKEEQKPESEEADEVGKLKEDEPQQDLEAEMISDNWKTSLDMQPSQKERLFKVEGKEGINSGPELTRKETQGLEEEAKSSTLDSADGSTEQRGTDDSTVEEPRSALGDVLSTVWSESGWFEGALEVKGQRVDLQGLRMVAGDSQAGPCFGDCRDGDEDEWITVQVKQSRKQKEAWGDFGLIPKREGGPMEEAEREQWVFSPAQKESEPQLSGPVKTSALPALQKGHCIPQNGDKGHPISKEQQPEAAKKFANLGWPSTKECIRVRRLNPNIHPSTWVPLTLKNIRVAEHIDLTSPLQEPFSKPVCNPALPASMHTLDHLAGVGARGSLMYGGEKRLRGELERLAKASLGERRLEHVATRIARAMEKNDTSWVLANLAALYWRIQGQGRRAIDCLRHGLHHAPHHMKDVALVSLANVLLQARLGKEAQLVAGMAVHISPRNPTAHCTLGNAYLATEDRQKALQCYGSALALQPEYPTALERLRAVQCNILVYENQ